MIDVVVFNPFLPFKTTPELEWETVRKYAKVVICDTDDMWRLPNYHILYGSIQRTRPLMPSTHMTYDDYVEYCIKEADVVTTTTEYMKRQLTPYNENVEVFPNALDLNQPQFKVDRKPYDRLRIGYMGSTTHVFDVEQLKRPLKKLWENYQGQFEIVIAGLPLEASEHEKKIMEEAPKGTVFTNWAEIMKDTLTGGGVIPDEYVTVLPYKNSDEYATMFNEFDISLIPVIGNNFNNCKSPLKLVESCLMRTIPIVSYESPYKEVIEGEDWFWTVKSPNDWYNHLSRLLDARNGMATLDFEEVRYQWALQYSMENQINKRIEFLDSLC